MSPSLSTTSAPTPRATEARAAAEWVQIRMAEQPCVSVLAEVERVRRLDCCDDVLRSLVDRHGGPPAPRRSDEAGFAGDTCQ